MNRRWIRPSAKMRMMALLALLCVWLAPAGPAGARDTLTIGVSQFAASLHPTLETHLVQRYILAMTQRPFTAFDANWQLACMLCTELPTLENGKAVKERLEDGSEGMALTYTIQPDAAWGDGTPISTDDVMFTYKAGRHPKSGIANAELYRQILSIDVIDDKTFVMHLDRVSFNYNAINDFRPLPAHIEQPIFDEDPATYRNRTTYEVAPTTQGLWFGPYRITEVASGAHVVLEPNPSWWGEPPYFKRIIIKTIENTAALEANLLAGDIDMIAGEAGLTVDQALAFEERHGDSFSIQYKPSLLFEHIALNLDHPALSDLRVRKALIQGIDREAINQQLFKGRQAVAHADVSPLDWIYHDDIPRYGENRDAAAALLDAAGWTGAPGAIRTNAQGEPLSLELMTTAGNRTRELVQQVLQSQWRRLGIDITIRNQPARVFFAETVGHRQFPAMAMFALYTSPENVPRSTLHSEEIPTEDNGWAGQNYAGYRNAEMDELLEATPRELDREKRRLLWHRIQEIYASELPTLPLFFRADSHIWPRWLKGVVPTGHQNSSALGVEYWRYDGTG